jgi:regulator of sigma E protease
MNISLLAGLIFVGVFAGVVLIHEFGHFVVARLLKVEVEEFGVGLPPRAWRFWRAKGKLKVGRQRIEIPRNYDLPFERYDGLNRPVEVTARKSGEKLILENVSFAATEDGQYRQTQPEVVEKLDGKVHVSGILHEIALGTEFTFNWLPLGGFVRPKGENDPDVPGGLAASSPWVRLGVLFAGSTMNLLAGLLVNSILFTQVGVPDMSRVMLYEVTRDSPAALAGLQADDLILEINGEEITGDEKFRSLIQSNLDQPMQITVQRGDEILEVTATPLSSRSAEEGALGILPGPPMVPAKSFIQAIPYGSMYTYAQMRQIVSLPVMIIRNQLSPEEGRFIGLKGIYDLFGQAVSRDVESREAEPTAPSEPAPIEPTNFTLQIIASLTLTLGIFNLLPFPALDGGRIIFVLPELILKRRVPPEFENVVHAVGFALLIAFMLYINAMDFINPVDFTLP